MPYSLLIRSPFLIVLTLLLGFGQAARAADVKITKAVYDPAAQHLQVTTSTKSRNGVLSVLHGEGGLLAESPIAGKTQQFAIPLARLGQVPCRVEARVGNQRASAKVEGAPAECEAAPTCKILAPQDGEALAVNQPFRFQARAKPRDAAAQPKDLRYEWDFGSGALGVDGAGLAPNATLRPTGLAGTTRFVLDDRYYRIRFAATDPEGRRCEAAVTVKVGQPPSDQPGFPAKVAEQPAPLRGAETGGAAGDLVVLPFQEWSMQHTSDMNKNPNGYDSFNHLFNTLNALVVEKGSVGGDKPKFLGSSAVALRYSAASNPLDPAGADSINSTSQNWPLNADRARPAPFMDAATVLKKTDIWETHAPRPPETLAETYTNRSSMQAMFTWWGLGTPLEGLPAPDEGYFPHGNQPPEPGVDSYDYYLGVYKNLKGINPRGAKQGRQMPGKDAPYAANAPQPFPAYDRDNQWFRADAIPITDIDDQGRVNPSPLLRVEAVRKGVVAASADAVLKNSRDFHCRECHAKGQIGANPNAGYKPEAFLSSPKGGDPWYFEYRDPNLHPDRPTFYDAASDSLYDQEYAASLNYSSLHDFYDGYDFVGSILNGGGSLWGFHNGLAEGDTPQKCNGCHSTAPEVLYRREALWDAAPYDNANLYYNPDYSMAMHRFHGELQYNADKSDILRNEKGAYLRFDWKGLARRTPGKDLNPNTLFPVFGPDGKQLPMEANCLRCHAGHREPLYDDRMATAGVTCFDCHGDMLAMGRAFPKNPAKAGSAQRADYRVAWFDETDCGSCHSGQGAEAVRTIAFDPADLSATSLPVDKSDPDAARFAVVPNYAKKLAAFTYSWNAAANNGEGEELFDETPAKVDAPLYRYGKDQHGGIACAACHGAAHAIGPNRNPAANDNLAAVQLQGYAGPVAECTVCHTKDAFNTEASIGSNLHYPGTDGEGTRLAGPHSLHPVNDPNWYRNRAGGAPNRDGTTYGGWHNVWSGKPGLKGEDQCAACHGKDHKGTRLSKTPVDRVFDFSGLDFAKLQAVGFKSKVVKVQAGTEVGCDTCHSIETSCTGSPAGSQCGTGTATQASAQ